MAETLAQQFLVHPRRNWMVGIAAAMMFMAFGLPVYDSIQVNRSEYAQLDGQLSEIKQSIANLQPLRMQLEQLSRDETAGMMTANQEISLDLREKVVRMIRKRDCRVKRVTLSDPQSRPWTVNDDPFATTASSNQTKTGFQLTTTHLSVSASGTLPSLSQILADVTKMHDYAVPTRMTLRNDGNDETVSLEMEFSLFHLDREQA
tara:strand:- start:230286 stop:230897 length:612 start_codon:yes stop_codon:yes gene_type:complete